MKKRRTHRRGKIKSVSRFIPERKSAFLRFLSYVEDMYAPPHTVALNVPLSGKKGAEQDANNIKGYFNVSKGIVNDEIERTGQNYKGA